MTKIITSKEYKQFFIEIKNKIYQSQYQALKAVNKELINLYNDIGKSIVEKQEKLKWGKSVVESLAKDLQKEFPGIKGFSSRNIWRMRTFYLEYKDNTKLPPLVAEIGWTHNYIILEKCKDNLEREFYIQMTRKFGWTKNVLIHQIEGQAYERFLLNQTNFDTTLPEKYKNQAKLAVKDEYNFDFLDIPEEHYERELEQELLKKVRKFLIEMGGYFTFVGNQYRLEVSDKEFYIDLLLYHRYLKCLIAIDLKTREFQPEHAGKMQFYLSVLNDKVRLEHENPSIGIIVCKSKNKTVVEYSLKDSTLPIGVSTYKTTKTLPKEMKKYLPSPKEIIEKLNIFNDSDLEKK
jgi:predicted nuclease of restriction endonuclease-like (RecB) superfamily